MTRLSRRVLVSLGAVAAVGGAAAVFLALRPQAKMEKAELYNTASRSTPDGLANLPKDYGSSTPSVPNLGPPMPGDLGRAFVAAGTPAPSMGTQAGEVSATAAEQARQRLAQESDAARESKLFDGVAVGGASGLTKPIPPAAVTAPAVTVEATPPSSDHKLAFLKGPVDRATESSSRLERPASPNVILAGSVIPAALVTGIRSDLPGQVIAQVTENVFDSPTGKILLIPQGARLIGQYDAQIPFGQNRALLTWTRMIMPDGRSIILERQPGADLMGQAGLQDHVDNHWGTLIKAGLLSTLLSVGAEAGNSDTENSLVQAVRQGASQGVSEAGQQVVRRSLAVQPTITVRPGFPLLIILTQDLVL